MKHHEHQHYNAAEHASRISSDLLHHHAHSASQRLVEQLHSHPGEFRRVLHAVDAHLKAAHHQGLVVSEKHGKVVSINFEGHDIYNQSMDRGHAQTAKRGGALDAHGKNSPEHISRVADHSHGAKPHYGRTLGDGHHGQYHVRAGHHGGASGAHAPGGYERPHVGHYKRSQPHFDGDRFPAGGKDSGIPNAASPSKNGFGEKLLTALGLPVNEASMKFLDAWQRAEGGSADNPFNTTQGMPGARRFNSVGVKRYASMEDGIAATVKTLQLPYYKGILSALSTGNLQLASAELRNGPWGTHNMPTVTA